MNIQGKIKFRFGFAPEPDGSKVECFLCGKSFPAKGVLVALHARAGEKVLADDATPICADCIFSGPKLVAKRARVNATRFKAIAPMTRDADEREIYMLFADILEALAPGLEKLEDFTRLGSFPMAAKVAEAYIN
jgi:hypothetical protein